LKEHDNIVPQKLFNSLTAFPVITSATLGTTADFAIMASSDGLYQVDTAGGSTAWGGTGGGGYSSLTGYATSNTLTAYNSTGVLSQTSLILRGEGVLSVGYSNGSVILNSPAAGGDGINAVRMGVPSGGTTTGAATSFSTATILLQAGSNMLISQTSDSIAFHAMMNISAGPGQNTHSAVIFRNTNNVGFTYTNSSVEARAWINVSGGTTGENITKLSFSNANGISFGFSGDGAFGGSVSASYTVPTVPASATQVYDVGTGGSTGTVTRYAPEDHVHAGVVRVAAGSNTGNTLGDTVAKHGNWVIAGSGGVTISGSTNVGGTHTAWVSVANQAFSADASSTFQTLTFQDSNGVSFSNNAGAIRVTHALQFTSNTSAITSNALHSSSPRVFNAIAATNSTGGGTASLSSDVSFSAANGVTFYTSAGNAIVGSVVTTYLTSQSNQAVSNSAGSFTFQTLNFSDANNVTWGTSAGGIITASVAAPGAAAENNWFHLLGGNTAGNTTASGSTIGLSGVNLTLSGTNGSVIVLSNPVEANHHHLIGANTAGNTTASGRTIAFSGINMTISGTNDTVFVFSNSAPETISSYENCLLVSNIANTLNGASVSHAVAFALYQPGSFSFLRLLCAQTSGSAVTLTTVAASLSASAQRYSTWNAVVYSLGTGASSQSLVSVASGSCGETILNSISVGADGTSGSYTLAHTYPALGFTTDNISTQYSVGGTVYSFTSNQIASRFTGTRFLDIPFANSLSAGPYWLIFGYSSSSATNSARVSAATSNWAGYSAHYGASQANLYPLLMGGLATSGGGYLGAGSFSTAGGGTTSILPIANISSSASNVRHYFQLLRSA
jgi:hypothetical protein